MPNPEVTPDASKAVGSHPRGRPRQQHPTLASRCRDSVSFVPGRDRRHLEHPPEVVDTRSQTCRTCRSRWPGSEGVATSTETTASGSQSGPADVATDALPHPCPSGTAPCNHVVHVLDGSAPPPREGRLTPPTNGRGAKRGQNRLFAPRPRRAGGDQGRQRRWARRDGLAARGTRRRRAARRTRRERLGRGRGVRGDDRRALRRRAPRAGRRPERASSAPSGRRLVS